MGKKKSESKAKELPANLRKMREHIRKVLASKRLTEVQSKLKIGMILQPLMEQMVVHGKRDAFDRLATALGNDPQDLIDCAMAAVGTIDPGIRKAVKKGVSWKKLQAMLEELCMGGLKNKCDNYYEQLTAELKGLSDEDLLARRASKCCRKCYAMPGELHIYGCSNEQCPDCGRQLLSCGCHWDHGERGVSNRLPWTGELWGLAECREFSLWAKLGQAGWEPCAKDDPDAAHDLNRLIREGVWDKTSRKYLFPPASTAKGAAALQ